MANRITNFHLAKYNWLSNFYPSPMDIVIHPDGETNVVRVPTAEHAYQLGKCFLSYDMERILSCNNPAMAKQCGKKVSIRHDWDKIKLGWMEYVLSEKFIQNVKLGNKLCELAGYELIEGNNWGDTFWGVTSDGGENHLGKLLMQIRDELLGDNHDR